MMDTESGMRLLYDATLLEAEHPRDSTQSLASKPTESAPLTSSDRTTSIKKSGSAHQCRICNRMYERADHHLKNHENRRPFKCDLCSKNFNRADLLSRHRASHDRPTNGTSQIQRADRVTVACTACVAAKVKCQDEKPCRRCVKKDLRCEITSNKAEDEAPTSGTGQTRSSPSQQNAFLDHTSVSEHEQVVDGRNPHYDSHASCQTMASTTQLSATWEEMQQHLPVQSQLQNPQPPALNGTDTETSTGLNYFDDAFHTFPFDNDNSILIGDTSFGMRTFGQTERMEFNLWNIDLDGVELAYQTNDNSTPTDSVNRYRKDGNSRRHKTASRRHAAFERSPWLWKPTAEDHALNDQENLSLDEENMPTTLTPSPSESSLADFSNCCIDSKVRDRMLSLVFSMRTNPKTVPSFASLALLNSIIHVYFVQESYRHDSLLHVGTFDPSTTLPELFVAIIAGGSTFISIPAVWKMGLALQEVGRHKLADFWEQNNSNVRNLPSIQAFMICLDVGLWSGFKRHMEIAESFAQPVVVMIRRSGAFGAQSNSTLEPTPNDFGPLLETKWKKWVEAESYKRLILHMFLHDNQASVTLHKPPLMYITEFLFPLPAARDLWLARTATDWRDLYLSRPPPPRPMPSFREVIHDLELLESLSEHIDLHLCVLTLLNGYWGQIWAFHQSSRFYPDSMFAHRLSLVTEHMELYRDLSELSVRLPILARHSQAATLWSELFMMLLHSDPDQLQRFAGKYGEEESKQATAAFRAWYQTPESRTAVWHAGQVFQAARQLTVARLRGFNAIALYYASLTLWIYGLTSASTEGTTQELSQNYDHRLSLLTPTSSSISVILDGPDSAAIRIFVKNGKGTPGITVDDVDKNGIRFVPLTSTDEILNIARGIYRNNFPDLAEPLPPLVENLGSLLRDLTSLPGSRPSRMASEVRETH